MRSTPFDRASRPQEGESNPIRSRVHDCDSLRGTTADTQEFRVAVITAGQSPRPKIFADLVAALPQGVEITEFGALDAFGEDEIAALRPEPGQFSIATELRTGERVLVSRHSVHASIQRILSRLKPDAYDLAVIYCTGGFDSFASFSSECRLIQSQPAIESAVGMLVRSGHSIGMILPNAAQVGERELFGLAGYHRSVTWLDASDESDWARVVHASEDCEVLLLNSVHYDEEAAARLRRETGLPVILPRRVLASAIKLIFDVDRMPRRSPEPESTFQATLKQLSPRENEVLWLMVEGHQSKIIGRRLGISPRTVSIHRANVLAKLGVPNTTTLAHLVLSQVGRSDIRSVVEYSGSL